MQIPSMIHYAIQYGENFKLDTAVGNIGEAVKTGATTKYYERIQGIVRIPGI